MARRLTEEQETLLLLAKYEPEMRRAFLRSIDDLTSKAVISDIERMLVAGDIDAIIKALGIEAAAYTQILVVAEAAFAAGGVAAINRLPIIRGAHGERLVFRFNARNPAAERRLLKHTSKMITRIVNEQRDAIRSFLSAGMKAGINPKQLSSQLVGVYDRRAGRRIGGVIGLSKPQERWLTSATNELMTGSKASLERYLTRKLRDRRFDPAVRKIIDEGGSLPESTISRMLNRYSDRMLKERSDTIARTEMMEALNTSKLAASAQMVDDLGIDPDKDAVKVWRTTADERTRPDHAAMAGVEVIGLDTPFELPDGSKMLHPCDTSLGAPAKQTIRCRCTYFVRLNYAKAI